jgi:hypothetical protein
MKHYTLNDIIEMLEDIRDNDDGAGSAEVRLAMQPNYPLAFYLANVCWDSSKKVVWLASSEGNCAEPYAPRAAFEDDVIEARCSLCGCRLTEETGSNDDGDDGFICDDCADEEEKEANAAEMESTGPHPGCEEFGNVKKDDTSEA